MGDVPLILGVDSSTQSTKAVLVDAADGTIVDSRSVPHPSGARSEVDPRSWLRAVDDATAGLLGRADAVAVGGQQHGMVALDADGEPVRDALLWNDTRSAPQAAALIEEMGGRQACADAIGSVLVASITSTKLRWLRENEPEAAARVASVLLPHDYLSAHLAAPGTPVFTDRGDASGTGYFDARTATWRRDLFEQALGHDAELPRVVAPGEVAAHTADGRVVAAGTGDNMAAALALDLTPADVLVSIGTSGVASTVATAPIADATGTVTGFADARGAYLPMVTTMNAAGILDLQARLLGVDHAELARLALAAAPGSGGLTLLPYYGGERTPDRPSARGHWSGLTPATTREDVARAAVEALLCSLADAVDALVVHTGVEPQRVLLTGGAARNEAVRALAPALLGREIVCPAPGEYVALGAARQAAWALAGTPEPPAWTVPTEARLPAEAPDAEVRAVRERYAALRDRLA